MLLKALLALCLYMAVLPSYIKASTLTLYDVYIPSDTLIYLSEIHLEVDSLIISNCILEDFGNALLAIKTFDKLEYLEISNSNIREIPFELCELTSIRSINFSHNRIQKIPSLKCMNKLEVLMLGYNRELSLNETIENVPDSLRILDLSNCGLNDDKCEMRILEKLEEINLYSNRLRSLSCIFLNFPKLQKVNIAGNYITYIPNCFKSNKKTKMFYPAIKEFRHAPFSCDLKYDFLELYCEDKFGAVPKSYEDVYFIRIANTGIVNLPCELFKCKNLKKLSLLDESLLDLHVSFLQLFLSQIQIEEITLINTGNTDNIPININGISSLKYMYLIYDYDIAVPESRNGLIITTSR